jgi:hypothetical protein
MRRKWSNPSNPEAIDRTAASIPWVDIVFSSWDYLVYLSPTPTTWQQQQDTHASTTAQDHHCWSLCQPKCNNRTAECNVHRSTTTRQSCVDDRETTLWMAQRTLVDSATEDHCRQQTKKQTQTNTIKHRFPYYLSRTEFMSPPKRKMMKLGSDHGKPASWIPWVTTLLGLCITHWYQGLPISWADLLLKLYEQPNRLANHIFALIPRTQGLNLKTATTPSIPSPLHFLHFFVS